MIVLSGKDIKPMDYRREIQIGLEKEHDEAVRYFEDLLVKYKDKKMIFDKIKDILEIMGNEDFSLYNYYKFSDLDKELSQVEDLIQREKFDVALDLINLIIKDLEDEELLSKNENERIFSITNPFEASLILEKYKDDKLPFTNVDLPFSYVYFLKGNILNIMGKHKEAKKTLEKGRKWNPVNTLLGYEYLESLFELEDYEEFNRLNKSIFNLSYEREAIEQGFLNMGIYLLVKEDMKAARGFINLAEEYGDFYSPSGQRSKYIDYMFGTSAYEVTDAEMRKYSLKYGFPLKPNRRLGKLAYDIGMDLYKNEEYDLALYYLEIAFEITEKREIADIIDDIIDMD